MGMLDMFGAIMPKSGMIKMVKNMISEHSEPMADHLIEYAEKIEKTDPGLQGTETRAALMITTGPKNIQDPSAGKAIYASLVMVDDSADQVKITRSLWTKDLKEFILTIDIDQIGSEMGAE